MLFDGTDLSRWMQRGRGADRVEVSDATWKVLRLKRRPPITHAAFHLVGEEVTVNDAKARRELGYASTVSLEEGLAEMRARVPAV